VVAVCQERRSLGGFALRTRYISFRPGRLAAIKMLNRPPFFHCFAASIQHRDIGPELSEVQYTFSFAARPRLARPLLHPIMAAIFRWETTRRLAALRKHFEKHFERRA
jgi:hypothetical protein